MLKPILVTVAGLLAITSNSVLAEQGTVKAMAPWEGSGQVFEVAPEQLMVLGRFSGIMYLENGQENTQENAQSSLDTALMLCPTVQEINVATTEAKAYGHCIITKDEDNVVYAKWDCTGVPGACEGEFTITGGKGNFAGISGGGKLLVRAALAKTAADLSSGTVIRGAAGLALWPELKYQISSK